MNQQELEKMIKDIIGGMGKAGEENTSTTTNSSSEKTFTYKDYPLGEKSRDKLRTPTGKNISEVTLEAVINGDITGDDVRITQETLEMQAQVAESRGRTVFAGNLRRAGELIAVPDDRILEIYNALRPYRSTKAELYAIAEELENKYGCKITSNLVRESADVCEARGRLKK